MFVCVKQELMFYIILWDRPWMVFGEWKMKDWFYVLIETFVNGSFYQCMYGIRGNSKKG